MADERAIIARFTPTHTAPEVTCFECGEPMQANALNMCPACISVRVDITAGAQRTGQLTFCKDCRRVLVPPNQWVLAERESGELLALLLKRLDLGAPELQISDAQFLWTEPHSRRTRVRVSVKKAEGGLVLSQSFDVEYTETTQQCPQCAKSHTHNKWVANVQIRQHVPHKRTILALEQAMLQHGAQKAVSSIKESREGLDLHFAFVQDARRLVQFVQAHAPARLTKSSQLVGSDTHTGKATYKFVFSLELAPLCRGDVVVLPQRLAQKKGGAARLLLCYRLNASLHFVDPNSCRTTQVSAKEYWADPFGALIAHRSFPFAEFLVLCIEPTGVVEDRFVLADATVCRMDDMAEQILVRTHLGGVLKDGDTAVGVDLRTAQFNDPKWDELPEESVPSVLLLHKAYPDKARKRRPVKRIIADEGGESMEYDRTDYDEFLDALDESGIAGEADADAADMDVDDVEIIADGDADEVY